MITKCIGLASKEPIQLIDITNAVQDFVQAEQLTQGFLNVMSKHTTATICLNESCEALEKDLKNILGQLVDPKKDYEHNKIAVDDRPNAHSHILSYLMGGTQTIPVIDGNLSLGVWQKIFFVELDGPRQKREFTLSFMGESRNKQ